jgi:hypothetical protein
MRRGLGAISAVALVASVAFTAGTDVVGANQVPPPNPTCDVAGTATVKRPLQPIFPEKDRNNLVTFTVALTDCVITGLEPTTTFPYTGQLVLKLKARTYGTWRFLHPTAVVYKGKITWRRTTDGKRLGKTQIANTTVPNPFDPIPLDFEPSAGVVLRLSDVIGPNGFFGGKPYDLVLATDLLAPEVYAPSAPHVSSFSVGSFHGNESGLVIGDGPL